MAKIELKQLEKLFGDKYAVKPMSLTINSGEFVCLLGPSGCGKTTTLRMISGLETASGGAILLDGENVTWHHPSERDVAFVFQLYALYPHMTVRENLGFSLKIAGRGESEITAAVDEAAGILGLAEYMDRTPGELSGGQRQRVAMGRAIVRHPDVFLFDEPLSNLDAKLRTQMRVEIKKLHQKVRTTIVYVTHDQVEAMTLADRIVIMKDGHIVQAGTPLEVFEHPVNTFVATFIGSPPMNLIEGTVNKDVVTFADGTALPVPKDLRGKVAGGSSVKFGFRAEDLMPQGHGLAETGEQAEIDLKINLAEPLGSETLLLTEIAGTEVQAKMFNPRPVREGETLKCLLTLDKCHLFDAASGESLRKHDGAH